MTSVVCNKKEKSYEQEFSFGLRASQVSATRLWAQLHTFSATDTGIIYRKAEELAREIDRRLCEAWGEIFSLAVLEWRDGQ